MYLHSTQVSLSLWCLLLIFKFFKKFWKSIYSVCFDGTEKINYFSSQIFLLIMSSYSYWVPQQGHCCDEAGGCKQVTGKRDWVKSRIPPGLLGSSLREKRGLVLASMKTTLPQTLHCELFIELHTLMYLRLLSCATTPVCLEKRLWAASKYWEIESDL